MPKFYNKKKYLNIKIYMIKIKYLFIFIFYYFLKKIYKI